jgi:hypothetical protein
MRSPPTNRSKQICYRKPPIHSKRPDRWDQSCRGHALRHDQSLRTRQTPSQDLVALQHASWLAQRSSSSIPLHEAQDPDRIWNPYTRSWKLQCRMDLPGPTTSVGTRTDYSVGPLDYPACATWHLKAWSTRTTQE